MNLLSVDGISKRFGERSLFSAVSFGLDEGQKMALVAKNGEGKTTLLDILAGKNQTDTGHVIWRKNIFIAYLEQDHSFDDSSTINEVLFQSDNVMGKAIKAYQNALNNSSDKNALEKAMNMMDSTKAWDYEAKINKLLTVFEMDSLDKTHPVIKLSGGQKKRLSLIRLLIDDPDVFIMDEPTNHLDVAMIEWLEQYLSDEKISLFMVTHDRYFLNRVCNQILELDQGEVHKYQGNYEYFLEKKAEREEIQVSEIEKAKNLYRKEVEWMRRMPKARGTKAKARVDSFYTTEDKAKQRLKKDEVRLSVKSERLGGKILELHHLRKAYGELSIIEDFNYVFKKGEKIGIAGKNGIGKTTFLNLIMGSEDIDGGKIVIGETVKFGYYTQNGMRLKEDQRIIEVVKNIAEVIPLEKGKKITASQLLERFLFSPKQQYTPVSKLSGGEKKRLYLLTILMSNPNFLILDEPTNDLDIKTIQILEDFLMEFNGCLLIVSHDRAFMDRLADHIFHFKGDGLIKDYNGTYSQLIASQKKEKLEQKKPITDENETKIKSNAYENKLSYMERREFNKLEKEIEKLEEKKEKLNQELIKLQDKPDQLIVASKELTEMLQFIEEKTDRWLELSERA